MKCFIAGFGFAHPGNRFATIPLGRQWSGEDVMPAAARYRAVSAVDDGDLGRAETISIVTLVRPEIPIASRTGLGSTIRPTSSTVTVVFILSRLPFGNHLARKIKQEALED